MPVLPEVGSISTVSGPIMPAASMASIIETPMRSFTLPIGLKNSSLARTCAFTPFICGSRLSLTIGVSPMVWVIESNTRPRPGSRAVVDTRVASAASAITNSSPLRRRRDMGCLGRIRSRRSG
jgi:hypothetical protein